MVFGFDFVFGERGDTVDIVEISPVKVDTDERWPEPPDSRDLGDLD